MRNRLALAVLVLAGLLINRPAFSDKPSNIDPDKALRDLAHQHIMTGEAAYNREDFQLAQIEYDAAYQIILKFKQPDRNAEADLMNNLSHVNERLGDYETAIKQARAFLSFKQAGNPLNSEAEMDRRLRDEQEGRIKRMQEALATPAVTPKPLVPQPMQPLPGQPPQPAAPQPRTSQLRRNSRRVPPGGLALTIVGGSLLVGSIGCGVGVAQTAASLSGPLTQLQIDGLVNQYRTLGGLTIGLGVGGLVATVGGIVWLVRSHGP